MILTAQEEFGVRCALTLARAEASSEEPALTLTQIAEAEGLTSAYAGKIMRLLVQAGVVESTRGRTGGYRLARPAREMPVAEVLGSLGGQFYDGEICRKPVAGSDNCVHNSDCAVRSLWSGLQSLLDAYLADVTLHDLASDEATMNRMVLTAQQKLQSGSATR